MVVNERRVLFERCLLCGWQCPAPGMVTRLLHARRHVLRKASSSPRRCQCEWSHPQVWVGWRGLRPVGCEAAALRRGKWRALKDQCKLGLGALSSVSCFSSDHTSRLVMAKDEMNPRDECFFVSLTSPALIICPSSPCSCPNFQSQLGKGY